MRPLRWTPLRSIHIQNMKGVSGMAYPYGEPLANIGSDPWDLTEFIGRDSVDLLARMVYAEARGESVEGKRGCAHVAKNRKAKNLSEFGGNTYEGVLLKKYQFEGMTTESARKPDLSSQAWQDSLNIAMNMSTTPNPIGNCLWFVTNSYYATRVSYKDGVEYYTFPGSTARKVVEKKVIGNHTFFRVEGY